jgi:hypothetical protein
MSNRQQDETLQRAAVCEKLVDELITALIYDEESRGYILTPDDYNQIFTQVSKRLGKRYRKRYGQNAHSLWQPNRTPTAPLGSRS